MSLGYYKCINTFGCYCVTKSVVTVICDIVVWLTLIIWFDMMMWYGELLVLGLSQLKSLEASQSCDGIATHHDFVQEPSCHPFNAIKSNLKRFYGANKLWTNNALIKKGTTMKARGKINSRRLLDTGRLYPFHYWAATAVTNCEILGDPFHQLDEGAPARTRYEIRGSKNSDNQQNKITGCHIWQ